MSFLRVRAEVFAMSRAIHQAAFAVASDGTLLMNVAHVDRQFTPSQMLQWALGQPGKVFVGVQMSPAEAKRVLGWCNDIHTESIAYIVGARERRARRRKRARREAKY
jgi:hypothetical protein